MGAGATTPPASTAERQRAVPADIPRPIMEITATRPVLGASTAIPSTDVQRPAPAAVRLLMTMRITAIPMVHGRQTAKRSISVPKRARPAAIPAMNTLTTPMQTATASVTTAARPSA